MKKYLLHIVAAAALLFAFSGPIFSQSTIRGTVKSGPSGTPVQNAPITIGGDLVGLTDASGNYSFGVASGSNTLAAVYNGNTISKTITFAPGDNWMNFWFNPPSLPSDFDGNYYHTVKIGTQTWTVENLLVTHYSDGTNIPYVNNNTTWAGLSTPGYCWYNNDFASYKATYGALYNWYTVNSGELCPAGWHMPSDVEWTTLTDYLGGLSVAGGKMKEASTAHWNSPNLGATNESGFTALGGGYHDMGGTFLNLGGNAGFWSSTEYSTYPSYAWSRMLSTNVTSVSGSYSNKKYGFSVRCISNQPTATISGTTTVCQNAASPLITFTGLNGREPYTFTYYLNDRLQSVVSTTTGTSVTIAVPTDIAGTFTYRLTRVYDSDYGTASASGTVTVIVNPSPMVDIGAAMAAICQGGTSSVLGGSIGGSATGGIWSTPAGGTFNPNASTLNATWTPPAGYSGTATLTLTTSGGLCGTASASKTQVVIPSPTSSAGPELSAICQGGTSAALGGSVGGSATGGTWSTLEGGTFNPNATTLNATWTPPTGFSGSATLTLETSGGSCGTVSASKTQMVTSNNTIALTSALGTNAQTICVNTAITPITYATTGASGVNITSMPAGVTGALAGNVVTISGTPTASGPFNYTVTLTGGCGTITTSGTITVTPINTITVTSAESTTSQTVCVNTAITNITYATTGATGIGTASGLPAGVTAAWAAGVITISGTPTASGVFNYAIPLTGGCGAINATGTITVSTVNTVGVASTTPTLCVNTALTNITHTTTGATGIGTAAGLPAGVTAAWAAGVITISGTPTASGVFNYSIPLTGGCGAINATGTITVSTVNTVGVASTTPTLCVNTALTNITHTTTGATGIGTASGLPAGVTAAFAANTITISGTPTASGVFNYTIPLTGGCGAVNATGTITVNALPTSPIAGTITQPTCAVATGSVVLSGLPSIGTWTLSRLPGNIATTGTGTTTTISGLAAGTYNYTVTSEAGCNSGLSPNIVINAQPLTPTAPVTSVIQPTCTLATGTITVTVQNTGETYSFDNNSSFQPSNTKSGLAAGNYNVIIKSTGGCNSVATPTTVNAQPPTPIVPNQAASISSGGTFTVTPNGVPVGTTYSWLAPTYTGGVTGGSAQTTQTNISGSLTIPSGTGTATYTVTPISGSCVGLTFTVTVTVISTCTPVTIITQPAYNSMCATSGNASFTVAASGTAPFTYQWQYNNGGAWETVANGTPTGASYTNATTATLSVTGITTGGIPQYRCYITNCSGGNNATSATANLTVNATPTAPVVFTITQPTCAVATGSVVLSGLPSIGTWTLSRLPGNIATTGTGTTTTISGLTAGTYTYSVTNSDGCISASSPAIVINTQPATPTAPVAGTITQPTCAVATGSVVLNGLPSIGTWTLTRLPGNITTTGTGTTTTISGLATGTCNLTVTNAAGCISALSANVVINAQPPTPAATASNNGPITPGTLLSLTGGPNEMSGYAWIGPNSFSSASQSPTVSASATTEMAGVYTLTVTNSNGCQSSATTTVTSNPFIVTNVNDNGIGSLRYALDNANSTLNVKEVITFDISGTGPFTLHPASPLPEITNPVIIDGYSQPGSSAKDLILLIEIDGTNAGTGSNGLKIGGGGCIVKGLIINRFKGTGIQITGSASNSILGNFIGVDFSGTVPKGNLGDGIQINGSSNNQIGGTSPGEGNVISGNNGAGVSILSTGIGNLISSNSIYSNGGIGIDLGGNGVTSNDTGDGDTGPNYLQNFPVLGSVNFSTGSVTITGSINSGASKPFILQFFASKLADNSGNGEGQTYIGSISVTTDGSGNTVFTQPFSIKSSWGTVITATATDNLGNTSEFSKTIGGFQDQTVGQWPLIYTLNKDGVPNITDGTDLDAVRASFQTWSAISTANIQFTEAGTTTSNKWANASDGVNLVSFEDDQFPFSYGVLAVAAKTLKIDEGTQKATIIDADIVVNPDFVNDIKYNLGVGYNNKNAGYFDIQSVITHEIGHVLGLLHTGVVGSTMFFTLNSGTKVRTLEQDDKSWASYGYPSATYNSTYGSISGNIKYGYDPQPPVAGALVYAISTSRQDSVHGYSDASGNYIIPGLIPGSYNVYIEPLDGNVNGYNLRPANISSYIYSNTVYTDYPGEFYNTSDEALEPNDSKSIVTVNVGSVTSGIDLVTNLDKIPPNVLSVSPTDVSGTLINVLSNFSIKFSEAVDEASITNGTCYLKAGDKTIGGSYTMLNSKVVLFDPESALEYSTGYTLNITQGVKDLRNNTLQSEFTQSFTTIPQDSDPPEINEVIPADTAKNVFVTDKIRVFFSEPMNKASVESGFTLSWTDSGGTKTAGGSFSWANDNTSFTFTPSGSLRENTGYTIRLLNSITDLSGIHMLNAESRTFTTVVQAQVIIKYLGPGNGNTSVPVTTPVVVDFSEPINPSTVNSATFKLSIGSTAIPGTFEFLNENSRVVFRPDANLSFNQIYTVSLTSGIQDVSLPTSSNLSASSTTFTTAAKFTVPSILYLEPSSGVVGNVVTITGTGFDPDPVKNKITFNGISAPVTKATLTSLTTEVPMGALSGPVEVTVNGTVSENTMYFYIIPESLDPCSNIIDNKSTGSSSSHDADVTEAVSVNGVLNTYAYITNPEQGTVSVLNLTGNETISTITVGNTPMKIDINPQGTKAYVTNFNSHTVSVISLVKGSTYNTVIAAIPVGIEPYGVAVTPDGKRVYVANYYSGNLSVIDEDPNSGGFDHVVANVSTGSSSSDVAVTADAGMVLVTGAFGLKIVNSNPADRDYNSVIANVSTGSTPSDVTATADAGLAIVSTKDGHVLVVNLHPENGDYSDAVIANVSTGTQGSNVEASADNMFVYITDTEHDQILVYQIGVGGSGTVNGSGASGITLIPHNKIPVPKSPVALAISADASRLYVIDTNAGTGLKEITTIAICCGPISPTKAIGDLIITIQAMINKGDIPKLRGYALIVTLNSALRNQYANRPKLELIDLNAFKALVNAYIKNKQISTAQGNALIKSINAIIAQLNGTKSGESEIYPLDRERSNQELILRSKLGVIYPNPFSQSVTINYEIAENKEAMTKVQIMIYDINGRLVGTLVDNMMQSGCYTTSWKGDFDKGGAAPYGTYFVKFRAGEKEEVSKIMLIKPR